VEETLEEGHQEVEVGEVHQIHQHHSNNPYQEEIHSMEEGVSKEPLPVISMVIELSTSSGG
jgi:hypothetical protein